jgi:DNA/RNA endonuclease G (NUC1)
LGRLGERVISNGNHERDIPVSDAVPQKPQSNRGVWKQPEDATRMLTIRREGLFVVTGPVYLSSPRKKIKNRVSVPDAPIKFD